MLYLDGGYNQVKKSILKLLFLDMVILQMFLKRRSTLNQNYISGVKERYTLEYKVISENHFGLNIQ